MFLSSDPSSIVEFSDVMYKNVDFAAAIYNALGPDGILTTQMGDTDTIDELPDSIMINDQVVTFLHHLWRVGFESLVDYTDDLHGRFTEPWKYVTAMKSFSTRSKWFTNEADLTLKIAQRAVSTNTGESPFRYFDGATMMSKKFAGVIEERLFCSQNPKPRACVRREKSLEPRFIPVSAMEVKERLVNAELKVAVVAKEKVEPGSILRPEICTDSVYVAPNTVRLASDMESLGSLSHTFPLKDFLRERGWVVNTYVRRMRF